MTLNEFLDVHYGRDGDQLLADRLQKGSDPNEVSGAGAETPLHVAARRRRCRAVEILLDHGAHIDAVNGGGKTAYAHAIRRRFDDIGAVLENRGASTALSPADRLAVAVTHGDLDQARRLLKGRPGIVRTGNPEEDRLLADVAGRMATEPVALLIEAGSDLTAPGLDGGTPLHQAAWFGQPRNAALMIQAGAPLEIFDPVHESSPIGWAVHGSRYSDPGAPGAYVELVSMFLEAGARVHYPGAPESDAYFRRLMTDASPEVARVLETRR